MTDKDYKDNCKSNHFVSSIYYADDTINGNFQTLNSDSIFQYAINQSTSPSWGSGSTNATAYCKIVDLGYTKGRLMMREASLTHLGEQHIQSLYSVYRCSCPSNTSGWPIVKIGLRQIWHKDTGCLNNCKTSLGKASGHKAVVNKIT